MKIFITGFAYQPYPEMIAGKLKNMGHEVYVYPFLDFYHGSSYISRKLWKLGLKSEEQLYEKRETNKLLGTFNEYKPDILLTLGHTIFPSALPQMGACKKILWLWDSIMRFPEAEKLIPYFDDIFCFEENDIPIINDRYSKNADYLPLGYDEAIYKQENINKDIDLCFIGTKTNARLMLLKRVADHMKEKGLNMFVGGKWFEEKHFWKQGHFMRKNLEFKGVLDNRLFTPEEINLIYNRSKICLNITVSEHRGLNPRTFEVLGSGNFLLMDKKEEKESILRQGLDYVEYDGFDDLITKIDYYLEHEYERERVAKEGYNRIKDEYCLANLIKHVLRE